MLGGAGSASLPDQLLRRDFDPVDSEALPPSASSEPNSRADGVGRIGDPTQHERLESLWFTAEHAKPDTATLLVGDTLGTSPSVEVRRNTPESGTVALWCS